MSFLSQNKVFKRNWNWLRPVAAPVPPVIADLICVAGDMSAGGAWFNSLDYGATWAPFAPGVESDGGAIKRDSTGFFYSQGSFFSRSSDGVIWTFDLTPALTAPIANVARGNNIELVFGALAEQNRSVGGGAFALTATPLTFIDAIYTGSQWIAVSDAPSHWATSPDGLTWTVQPEAFYFGGPGLSGLVTIFYCGARLIVTGANQGTVASPGCWYSNDDGATWAPAVVGGVSSQTNRNSATDNVSAIVVIGVGIAYRYSLDGGLTYTGANFPAAVEAIDIVYRNSLFLVLFTDGTVRTSPDAVTWTLVGDVSSAGFTWFGGTTQPQLA